MAAASGRLLAVTYLLGVCANPNVKDRWGGTPLDDCVRVRYDIWPYSSVKAYYGVFICICQKFLFFIHIFLNLIPFVVLCRRGG